MADTSDDSPRRGRNGRWVPGASGNAAGKPPGARHKTTLAIEKLLSGEARALTRRAIEKALEGDVMALRLCLDRIAPVPKGRPVAIGLPAVTNAKQALEAMARITEAVGAGEITTNEAVALGTVIEAARRTYEIADLEQRVTALEAKSADIPDSG